MNHSAPLSLINSKHSKHITVQWSSEETEIVSHHFLRGVCPCAKCRAARLKGHIPLVNADVELVEMNPMGYGLQMVFSDGHDRGIYPWSYLRYLIKSK